MQEVDESIGAPDEMTDDEVKADLRIQINVFTTTLRYAKYNQPRKLREKSKRSDFIALVVSGH